MSPLLIALIRVLVSEGGPAAISIWGQLEPIIARGREPSPEEWLHLRSQVDDLQNRIEGE